MMKRWESLYLEIQILSNEINGLVIFQGRLIKLTGITGITAFSEQSNGLPTTLAGG
jgi:hypothetical protein